MEAWSRGRLKPGLSEWAQSCRHGAEPRWVSCCRDGQLEVGWKGTGESLFPEGLRSPFRPYLSSSHLPTGPRSHHARLTPTAGLWHWPLLLLERMSSQRLCGWFLLTKSQVSSRLPRRSPDLLGTPCRLAFFACLRVADPRQRNPCSLVRLLSLSPPLEYNPQEHRALGSYLKCHRPRARTSPRTQRAFAIIIANTYVAFICATSHSKCLMCMNSFNSF